MADRAFIERYLEAIASGATGDTLAAFFHHDVVQEEFPNRLVSTGASRDLPAILDSAEKGQAILTSQSFELTGFVGDGERAAVEALWTGVLAVPVGSLDAGDTMRARFAMFFEFRDGLIWRQRNYDCFDPF